MLRVIVKEMKIRNSTLVAYQHRRSHFKTIGILSGYCF